VIDRERLHEGERVASAILLFVGVYLATLLILTVALPPSTLSAFQWSAVTAAIAATALSRRLFGAMRIGFSAPLVDIVKGIALGALVATAVLFTADLLIRATSGLETIGGGSMPWSEILLVITPAIVHEELLMRGWAFRRIARFNPTFAIIFTSTIFGALHLGNPAISAVALVNIVLGGAILASLVLLARTLWASVAAHWVWNVIAGPILGHEVSGYLFTPSLRRLADPGPTLMTGGQFGIEASLWMTVTESAALAFVLFFLVRREKSSPPRVGSAG
jgi:membrane protease YdiL (CAAX protease family)